VGRKNSASVLPLQGWGSEILDWPNLASKALSRSSPLCIPKKREQHMGPTHFGDPKNSNLQRLLHPSPQKKTPTTFLPFSNHRSLTFLPHTKPHTGKVALPLKLARSWLPSTQRGGVKQIDTLRHWKSGDAKDLLVAFPHRLRHESAPPVLLLLEIPPPSGPHSEKQPLQLPPPRQHQCLIVRHPQRFAHERGNGEEREYGQKGTSTPLPLFLNFIAGAARATIVPLHSPFPALGLIYESCCRQPKSRCLNSCRV
jgi:hypothetical protein